MDTEIEAIVTGRVQRVMFRDFACRKGRALGLAGQAENLPDGSVRVIAQGSQAALAKFVERLRSGSVLSRVDDVRVEWRKPTVTLSGFSLIRSSRWDI